LIKNGVISDHPIVKRVERQVVAGFKYKVLVV